MQIDSMVNFFQEVQICNQQSLCDAGVTQSFLSETGRRIWDNFEPYFVEQRVTIPSYAVGLEQFIISLPKQ